MTFRRTCLGLILFASSLSLHAWDYQGHRLVNQLALAGLPAEFPAFVRAPDAAERIAFLAGEPDRWRNVPDPIMKHSGGSWTDHFVDLEDFASAGLDPEKLPSFRYEFAVVYAAARQANIAKFPVVDPAKNLDRTKEWPGFAPWTITEYQARLRSAFSYLKTFQETGGTPAEIANAEANVIYTMGVMGHFVGDLAQPLHTTIHFNGWVGENPKGYTTWNKFHSWIDGGFFEKTGFVYDSLLPRARPAKVFSFVLPEGDTRDPIFAHVMTYLIAQHKQLEPLYALDKAGKLRAEATPAAHAEGLAFLEGQLLTAGEMLSSLWVTAWRSAVPDTYLRTQLIKRASAAAAATAPAVPAAASATAPVATPQP